jgi:hypothetical protein
MSSSLQTVQPVVPGDHLAQFSRRFHGADAVVPPVPGATAVFGRDADPDFRRVRPQSAGALLTVGSLSDHLGRKPVIFTAVLLNIGDAAVYQADSVGG